LFFSYRFRRIYQFGFEGFPELRAKVCILLKFQKNPVIGLEIKAAGYLRRNTPLV
jgi:hypothetical protein